MTHFSPDCQKIENNTNELKNRTNMLLCYAWTLLKIVRELSFYRLFFYQLFVGGPEFSGVVKVGDQFFFQWVKEETRIFGYAKGGP